MTTATDVGRIVIDSNTSDILRGKMQKYEEVLKVNSESKRSWQTKDMSS